MRKKITILCLAVLMVFVGCASNDLTITDVDDNFNKQFSIFANNVNEKIKNKNYDIEQDTKNFVMNVIYDKNQSKYKDPKDVFSDNDIEKDEYLKTLFNLKEFIIYERVLLFYSDCQSVLKGYSDESILEDSFKELYALRNKSLSELEKEELNKTQISNLKKDRIDESNSKKTTLKDTIKVDEFYNAGNLYVVKVYGNINNLDFDLRKLPMHEDFCGLYKNYFLNEKEQKYYDAVLEFSANVVLLKMYNKKGDSEQMDYYSSEIKKNMEVLNTFIE